MEVTVISMEGIAKSASVVKADKKGRARDLK
jgi:hypothetical protein